MSKESILTQCCRKHRIVVSYFDKKFKEFKCPIIATQYELLRAISESKFKNLTDLGKNIGMDRTTLSKRIPFFIKEELIIWEDKIKDKRVKRIIVTAKGLDILNKFSKLYKECDVAATNLLK
jgi:DNA-binding MarR family transcriptional regulator